MLDRCVLIMSLLTKSEMAVYIHIMIYIRMCVLFIVDAHLNAANVRKQNGEQRIVIHLTINRNGQLMRREIWMKS